MWIEALLVDHLTFEQTLDGGRSVKMSVIYSDQRRMFMDHCLRSSSFTLVILFFLLKVPNVTWSTSLQKQAEDWVKYLAENNRYEHEIGTGSGENLFRTWYKRKEYCSDAVWSWHQEEQYYDYNKPSFTGRTGHFTQVTPVYYQGLTQKLIIPEVYI